MSKNKKMFSAGICIAALFFVSCASGDSVVSPRFKRLNPDTIGVVDIRGDISRGAPMNQVDDFFTMELMKKGYRVVERQRVDGLLREQGFQHTGVTDYNAAARMGRVLNVPAVAMLDVHVAGEKVSMTCRIVDSETAEVIFVGGGRGGSGRGMATVGGAIGGAMAGSKVGDGRTGAVAGGVLGGTAGNELAPQTARVVQKAIRAAVRDLPKH